MQKLKLEQYIFQNRTLKLVRGHYCVEPVQKVLYSDRVIQSNTDKVEHGPWDQLFKPRRTNTLT